MRLSLAHAAVAATLVVSSTGFSWGQKGHQMVNRVAVSLVTNPDAVRFMRANSNQVIAFASTPDMRWKSGPNVDKEKPMHWFQMDRYSKNPMGEGIADLILSDARQRLGDQYVNENGLAMWRVSDLFAKMTEALKQKNWQAAVQIAGVVGHYVGDMTQPMHATSNYDGQSINKPGIHKYYETTLVDRMPDQHFYDTVLSSAGPMRSGLERSVGNDMDRNELQHLAYTEAETAYSQLDEVLADFEHGQPNDQSLMTDLQPRLARASALLAKLWDVAFVTAGVQGAPGSSVNAQEPAWIPMN